MKYLFVKMFAGRYNNRSIGHEVINLYQHDNYDSDDYSYLYIPPYGSYGRKNSSFIDSSDYKDINTIFFFEQERGYICRLVAIARDVIGLTPKELVELPKTVKFSYVSINDISFTLSEDDDSNQNIFGVTYKVNKDNYFDARKMDLLFYPKNKQNEVKDKSPHPLFQAELANAWHIYTNKSTPCFDKWWDDNKEKICISRNRMIPENLNYDFDNNYNPENFLYFIDKEDDENIVTNMLFYFLKNYDSFRNSFTKFLSKSIKEKNKFNDCDIKVEKQKVAITEEQKRKNQFLRSTKPENQKTIRDDLVQNYNVPEEWFNKKNEIFKPGYIDLYLEGDSFRIVVENKIKSGLNGLFYDEEQTLRNQLDKYRSYLDFCNKTCRKDNYILIIAPDYNCTFGSDITCNGTCTYSQISKFLMSINIDGFKKSDSQYFSILKNSILKHSISKNQEIKLRFINQIRNSNLKPCYCCQDPYPDNQ